MDDFGTGYSSLAFLQRLPIDVLKIDRSFVTGMMVDPDSVAIVRAVLSLAEALGMSTTAEGIETVELATTLATLGCASGQGFYFAKPLEPEAAHGLLALAQALISDQRRELVGDDAFERVAVGKAGFDPAVLDPAQRSRDDRAFGFTPRAISLPPPIGRRGGRQPASDAALAGSPASNSRSTALSVPTR